MSGFRIGLALALWAALGTAWGAGDPAAGKAKSKVCSTCHGADGNSTNPDWPKLAGQNARYIIKQLHDLKEGTTRTSSVMGPMAKPLGDQDIADLAAYFSSQDPKPGYAEAENLRLGERVYRAGNAGTGVPACMGCHGVRGGGNPLAGFPRLSGQHAKYVRAQLELFRAGTRANDPNRSMRGVARFMSDAEIEAVANYISGLH